MRRAGAAVAAAQVAVLLAAARVLAAPEGPPASRRPVPVAMDLGSVAVGRWAEYKVTSGAEPTATMRVALVAKGPAARTLEVTTEGASLAGKKVVQTVLPARASKATRPLRTIVQIGEEDPMELSAAASGMPIVILKTQAKKLVGTEKLTTGTGAFLAKHYREISADGDVWVSDGVPPLGVVRVIGEQRGEQGAGWFEYELKATGRDAKRQINGAAKSGRGKYE